MTDKSKTDSSRPVPEPVPQPKPGCPHNDLPHALTFYLSAGQRKAVLQVLRHDKRSRGESLLRALGINENN
jgi:hypothetical protein